MLPCIKLETKLQDMPALAQYQRPDLKTLLNTPTIVLLDILPLPAPDAELVSEPDLASAGPDPDPVRRPTLACPLPHTGPARPEAALALQPVHVDDAVLAHRVPARSARPT